MSASPIQAQRVGRLVTPLGAETLVLIRMDGSEAINELFEFRVEAYSSDADVDLGQVVGTSCTLEFDTRDHGTRYFNGICAEARNTGFDITASTYSLVLRPWLWMLSKRVNTKIFPEKTVLDIISEVFGDYGGVASFRQDTTKSYPTLEYTVQYRESDLDFVMRLMAHYGISFHFEHKSGSHELVLADSPSAYQPVPGSTRPFFPEGDQRRDEEHFDHWSAERRFTANVSTTLDYNYKTPTADLKAEESGDAEFENGTLEVYDYPTKNLDKGEGTDFAKVRTNALRAEDKHFFGAGDVISLSPGMTVTLERHVVDRYNTEYLTVAASHSYTGQSFRSGGTDTEHYSGSYEFVESSMEIAPTEVVKEPSVLGPQSGVVVGEGEIDVDEDGRILVLFHWDRDKTRTKRCRVAQVWAGSQWGGVFWPRVGMEVVVEFLDGDPDKPIVTGCLYNKDNMPPYDLPSKKNIAGWKSDSTEGGGGYNEYVFDDTKGDELIRQHAQYDMETKVLHDERREVDNNRDKTIGVDETNTIGNDRTTTVGKMMMKGMDTLTVGKELFVEAGMKITFKVGASTIVMDAMNITITSPNVKVNASMQFESSAGIMSKHFAGAVMDIKGGLVKINS